MAEAAISSQSRSHDRDPVCIREIDDFDVVLWLWWRKKAVIVQLRRRQGRHGRAKVGQADGNKTLIEKERV